jgi:hypothetical protein
MRTLLGRVADGQGVIVSFAASYSGLELLVGPTGQHSAVNFSSEDLEDAAGAEALVGPTVNPPRFATGIGILAQI